MAVPGEKLKSPSNRHSTSKCRENFFPKNVVFQTFLLHPSDKLETFI